MYGVLGSSSEVALRVAERGGIELRVLGGEGSGHFGHVGQGTGEVGGSGKGTGTTAAVVAQITSDTPPKADTWPIGDDVLRQTGAHTPEMVAKAGEEWLAQLTPEEKASLEHFSIHGYMPINAQLRHMGGGGGQDQHIKNINSALADAPMAPPPDLVWRGVDGNIGPFIHPIAAGDELVLDGLQSATLSPRVADDFPMMLEIKPLKGAYIEPITKQGGEKEYLIPHNSKFRVRGVTRVQLDLGKGWTSDHEIVTRKVLQLEQIS